MRVRCGIPAAQDRRKTCGVRGFALGGGGLKEGASWGGAAGMAQTAWALTQAPLPARGGVVTRKALEAPPPLQLPDSWQSLATGFCRLEGGGAGGCSKAIWVQMQGWMKYGHCCNGLIVVADLGLALPARAGRQHGCWAAWWCWCALEAGAWWRRRWRTSVGRMTTTARRLVRALATMTGPLL